MARLSLPRPVPRAHCVSQWARCGFATIAAGLIAPGLLGQPSWEAPPDRQGTGQFWRAHWYERGLTNGNPGFERRFRINSPEVVLHPEFGRRVEARENGMMLIQAEEDLFQIVAAEFYCELWGGHPGTANKRMTVNGRSTYPLPRAGTEEKHCTYSYPGVPLKISDLVNGWNAFQFALDQGSTFWGHAIVDHACLRVALTNGHADLRAAGLANFAARVVAVPLGPGSEGFMLQLECPEVHRAAIAAVDFQGWFDGYDENGNTRSTDWHGFTKGRQPQGHLGTAASLPFALRWDTTMLPAQENVAVRAVVHLHRAASLMFVTAPTRGLAIRHRDTVTVALCRAGDLPTPFWSRAGQKKQCTIDLEVEPDRIESAELHVNAWTGGPGSVRDYFTLNGQPFPVAEGSRHELVYSRLKVDPKILRRGANQFELHSDTEHHGIEILLPGPALMIRWRTGK
jgi:hypothetical protein